MAKYKLTIEASQFSEDTIALRKFIVSEVKTIPGADVEEVASTLKTFLDNYDAFIEKAKEFVNIVDLDDIDIYDNLFDDDFDVNAFRELRKGSSDY